MLFKDLGLVVRNLDFVGDKNQNQRAVCVSVQFDQRIYYSFSRE